MIHYKNQENFHIISIVIKSILDDRFLSKWLLKNMI